MQFDINNKWEKKCIFAELLMAGIVLIYTLLYISEYVYRLMWVLPLGYLVTKIIFYQVLSKIKYDYGVVFVAANFIVFIRYIVTPFSIVISNTYNGMGYGLNPSQTNVNYAFILMLLELISIYFCITFAIIHYKKKQNLLCISKEKTKYLLKNKLIVTTFLIIFLPFVLIVDFSSLLPKSLSSIGEISYGASQSSLGGILFIIVSIIRLIILFLILSVFKRRYDKNNSIIYIILSWLIVALYLAMLISTSRWIIIFSAIVCLIIISRLFPKTPKIFYIILITLSIIIFFSISIYKYSWEIRLSSNPYKDILIVLLGQFQEYFSGPRVVAQGLEMIDEYKGFISATTFFNDFLGSVPIVSRYINQLDRINVYFNQFLRVGNVTHIIPMIINGYVYFPFLPIIFSVISYLLVIKFDYKSKITNDLEFQYLYSYMGLFFAMSMGFNVQIVFGNFLVYFLFPWVIFALNRKITFWSFKR